MALCFIVLVFALNHCLSAFGINSETGRNFTLPITKRAYKALGKRQTLGKRQKSATIGLGDSLDLTYSVEITVGSTLVPVVLDTGSSDLWSISSACSDTSCGFTDGIPRISTSSLKAAGVSVELDYGDSADQTFASGMIYSGPTSIAGLQMNDQFLVAVNTTDAGVSEEGLSGIFGLGFPLNSAVLFELLEVAVGGQPGVTGAKVTDAFIAAVPQHGPLVARLAMSGQIAQPMFTVTLQRESVEVGGNVGQLTIGQLPDGVSNDSLTWVPVRLYADSEAQGGIPGPTDSPKEIYPISWEIPIDDVLLNGKKLVKPSLGDIGYTALVDSGTSSLLGPADVVTSIYSSISSGTSGPSFDPSTTISCSTPVDLTYVIGGKNFPVDPRDFLGPQSDTEECLINLLSPTDDPQSGGLMSWILGDPFMKSNLVAFYYGNLTHPSVDPPRMGFLSTVPSNANDIYGADVSSAASDGDFIFTSVIAPTGTLSAAATNSVGVAQAPSLPTSASGSGSSGGGTGGGSGSGSGGGSGGGSSGGSPGLQNGTPRLQVPWLLIAVMTMISGAW